MTPKQARPLIINVLKMAQKYPPKGGIEELADNMVGSFEAFESSIQDAGLIISTQPTPKPASVVIQVNESVTPPPSAKDNPDIFRRLGAPEPQLSEDEIVALKVKIVMDYRVTLPNEIATQPAGFDKPIVMLRHTVGASQGAMPFVEIAYVLPNAKTSAELVRTIVNVLKPPPPTAQDIVAEMEKQAAMLFSAVPKTVVAKAPPPRSADNWMADSVTDITDKDTAPVPSNWMDTPGDRFTL